MKVDVEDFEAAFKKVSYKIATNVRNHLTEHVINQRIHDVLYCVCVGLTVSVEGNSRDV